jgi:MraZ protein
MFLGEYEYKVDSKGRLPLPPKFRQELLSGLVLTRGAEQCIIAYPKAEFEKISSALAPETIIENEQRRKLKRAIFSSAEEISIDGQGRIALQSRLKEYAQIKDTAIVAGINNRIEIWNPDTWNSERVAAEEQMYQIIEKESLESTQ